MWVDHTIHEWLACTHIVSLMDIYVLSSWDEILLGLTKLWGNDDPAFTLQVLSKGDHTVYFCNDGVFLGLSHLEELCHPGKTTCNVLGLGGVPWDLC